MIKMAAPLAALLSLLAMPPSSAVAQPANWRTMTPEQLNNLPKEQTARLPMFAYFERVDPTMKRTSWEFITATVFSRLLFALTSRSTRSGLTSTQQFASSRATLVSKLTGC